MVESKYSEKIYFIEYVIHLNNKLTNIIVRKIKNNTKKFIN